MTRAAPAALVLCLLAAACGGPAADGPATAPPVATAELRQFRSDLARRMLEVTVTAREALQVTSVALTLDGFTTLPPTEVAVDLPVGTALDLPVPYGEPDCAAEPGAARAVLRTAAGAPVELALPDRGLVARLHDAECAEQALARAVEVTVDPVWTPAVRDGRPSLVGTVRLVRRVAGEQVVLDELGANVVFAVSSDVERTPLLVLGPDEREATVTVVLSPVRCEAHALAESKRTSLVTLYLGLGDRSPRLTTITPAPAVRARLEAFAVSGCREAGSAVDG